MANRRHVCFAQYQQRSVVRLLFAWYLWVRCKKCFALMEGDVAELMRQVLEGRHLPTSGTKLELEARLQAAEVEEQRKIEQMMTEFANEKRGQFEASNSRFMAVLLAHIAGCLHDAASGLDSTLPTGTASIMDSSC